MEASVRIFQVNNTPSPSIYGRLADPDWAYEFTEFLETLGELLKLRPIPCEAVDLIHLLAMAIHPLPPTVVSMPSRVSKHPSCQRAQTFMRHLVAPQFFLLDCHRQSMLKLVSENLVLPSLPNEYEAGSSPLLYGAWPHLLQSLLAVDENIGVDVARLAVQLRNVDLSLKPLWDYYLNELIDSNDTPCFFCSGNDQETGACLFLRRAERLAFCLSRDPPEGFRQHALLSLSEAIEWQYECNLDTEENKDEHFPPCLLAALLRAAIPSGHNNESIVRKAVHLLVHPSRLVVEQAAKLLTVALQKTEQHLPIEQDLLSALSACSWPKECTSLVALVSSIYRTTAAALLDVALDLGQRMNNRDASCDWIIAIANNAPVEATRAAKQLREMIGDNSRPSSFRIGICEALLAIRLASFYSTNEYFENRTAIESMFASSLTENLWDRYKLAKHSMSTGDYEFSASTFDQLHHKMQQEKSYVWLKFLHKIALAEATLTQDGALGIPAAVKMLVAARSCAENLEIYDCDVWTDASNFHVQFLSLRIDFLRLSSVLRNITMESKLTGSLPKKTTRSFLHLKNLRRALKKLSSQYDEIIHWYGACFDHQQSFWAVKLHGKSAKFFDRLIGVVFNECLTAKTSKAKKIQVSDNTFTCRGNHPVAIMLRRMENDVVRELDSSVPIDVRISALLQLLDALVRVPVSLPRDFFKPVRHDCATFEIVADGVTESGSPKTIEALPMISFTLTVSGTIPMCYLQHESNRTVILWLKVLVDENAEHDDASGLGDSMMVELPDFSNVSPVSASLLPQGGFFADFTPPPFALEGFYIIHIKLGLQDGRNRWAIPSDGSSSTVQIVVKR